MTKVGLIVRTKNLSIIVVSVKWQQWMMDSMLPYSAMRVEKKRDNYQCHEASIQ